MVRQDDWPSSLPTSALSPATPSITVLATMRAPFAVPPPCGFGAVLFTARAAGWLRYVRGVQRLVRFVLGVAAVLAAIEVAFRLWEPAIAASANRILTKAA